MKKFIGCYNKSVILTYFGVFFSLLGIATSNLHEIPVIFLVVAGICDLFDGSVARKCKRTEQEKAFGVQIDSLADVISFGVLPFAFLINTVGFNALSFAVGVIYVLAAVSRLAWFNITTEENKRFYQGLPVTYSALIIPCIYIPLAFINSQRIISVVYLTTYLVLALLFVINIKIKKPSLKAYIAFSCLAILVVAIDILLFFMRISCT